jgi:hypothetical protein
MRSDDIPNVPKPTWKSDLESDSEVIQMQV